MTRFKTFDGLTLAYSDVGEGLPVLCLAGLTRNGSDFDYVAPYLNGARVIRLDYRGRGASGWADPATYTVPTEARDVVALLDYLELDKVAVLGTSRGGLIAMMLAATVKDRLLGVCLNDIGPVVDPTGLDVIRGYVGKSPSVKTYEEAALAKARLMTGFVGVPASRWLEEARKQLVETDHGLKINYDPDLAKVFEFTEDNPAPTDFWPVFEALKGLPLALIRGANSDLLTAETAAEMQARCPEMIFAEVPDRAHVPFLDEPEAVAAIRSWLGQMQ